VKRTGVILIASGAALFAFGGCVLPPLILVPYLMKMEPPQQFLVPGTNKVHAKSPGTHYLWHDYETIFNGRSYSQANSLPDGMEITLRDPESGEAMPLVAQTSVHMRSGSSQRQSVGYFELARVGDYQLTVDGAFPPRVFSFGKSIFGEFVPVLVGGFAATAVLALGGIGLIIAGVIKVGRQRQPHSSTPPPTPPGGGG
jgi:hypothetical protein